MISTYFTFPVLNCSPLFLASCGFILVLEDGHMILCIFVKSKADFYAFFVDSNMVVLLLFINNLCISLFWNDLNMDPSLNLIFKDHGLVFFWFHLYPAHRHLWNGARFNCVISVCACSVSIFTFSSVFGIFGVSSVTFGLAILVGCFWESHMSHWASEQKHERCG